MEKSENTVKIYAAIVKFQSEVPVILKENMVKDKYGKDKYTYADMADIKNTIQPHMAKNELGLIQSMDFKDDFVHVITEIIHSSGQWLRSSISAQVSINVGYMSQIQAIGSVSTYIKRYALSSMLGLVTDQDRDGNVDQDAQRKIDDKKKVDAQKKLETAQTKAVEEIESIKDEIHGILNKITDANIVLKAEKYMENNKGLESMQKLLANMNSALDTENSMYPSRTE